MFSEMFKHSSIKRFAAMTVSKINLAIFAILFTGALFSLSAQAAANSSDRVRLLPLNQFHLAQQRECSQRVGPFVTQDTAWQRLQEARSQGYGVSDVFPCYDEYGTRGYCFNVFFLC
jgi:hypothetical protein